MDKVLPRAPSNKLADRMVEPIRSNAKNQDRQEKGDFYREKERRRTNPGRNLYDLWLTQGEESFLEEKKNDVREERDIKTCPCDLGKKGRRVRGLISRNALWKEGRPGLSAGNAHYLEREERGTARKGE